MKVLQINSYFSAGGTARVVNRTYETLLAQGHECKIAAARSDVRWHHDSIQIGSKISPWLNALSCRLFDDDGFRSKSATRKLIMAIKEYDPDVIHLHNLHGYYINIEILFEYLKQCRKKIFWTLHDCWAFTGHCPHFILAKCEQWKTHCTRCVQTNEYPRCIFKGNVPENFRRKKAAFTGVPNLTIITPSRWLANLVKESFLKEYPVEVRYNQINTTVFKPTESDFRKRYNLEGQYIILGVANCWTKRKGLDDFIALSMKLDDKSTVVLVGLDKKQKTTLPTGILALNRTNSTEELAAIYTAADVFFNPTYEDTYPTVNLEAEACGTPVITYRTGGAPETIHNEKSSTIDAGDISAFIQCMKKLI